MPSRWRTCSRAPAADPTSSTSRGSESAAPQRFRSPRWHTSWPDASIGATAYRLDAPVRTNNYPAEPYAVPERVERGARAAMAAPVHENGAVVGSLVVVSFRPDHGFTEAHERTLLTFADQVSVAMSDARTLATAQHAFRDPVTGLPNRMGFLQRLERAISRATAESRAHVLFLDLDRFKLVNDTLGHAAGDELLREI